MSATIPDSEIITAYRADLISNYSVTAALGICPSVIVCYEFIATFRHEYELVWKRRWTGFPVQRRSVKCDNSPLQFFLNLFEVLPGVIVAAFSALRVFALLDRTYVVATFTFALGVAPVALDLYLISQATHHYVDDPVLGSSCYVTYLMPPSVLFHSEYVLSTIATDVVAIAITWIKTYRHVREASSVGANVGFGATLLQYGKMSRPYVGLTADSSETGSLYFIALFVVDFADGLVLLAPFLMFANPIAIFTAMLPSIVLSRFLINLRQVNAPESGSAARLSRFSPPNFRIPSIPSIVGNLGEPLAHNEDDLGDEDHIVGDACEDGTGAAVNSGEEIGTSASDVIDIDIKLVSDLYECCARLAKKPAHALGISNYETYIYGYVSNIHRMSATTPDAIISAYKANLINNYTITATLVIVCYEVIALFKHEYELVWKRRWTGATCLFFANRCYNYPLQYFLTVLGSLSTVIMAAFSALRVFALLGHTYILAAFTFALGLAPIALDVVQASQGTWFYVDDPLCSVSRSTSVAGMLAAVATDVIAIATTWIKTYRHVWEASSVGADASFGTMLLRYGSLYFMIPNIILSRFLINLRQVNVPESGNAARFSRFSPPNFRMPSIPSIVGNLGELLARNEDDPDNEDHIVTEAVEDDTGAAVNSGEEADTSDVIYIGIGEIEDVHLNIGKMSATTPDAEIIRAYQQNLNYNYSVYAALTPFRHEYQLVWKRKWTAATWLFLANRCYNFPFQYFLAVLETLPTITIAAFSALRVFALLGHAYITAAFTFALGVAPVALGLASPGLAGTLSTIATDVIAIVITWIKTYRHVREASSVGANVRFGAVLLRYGSLFFMLPNIILSRFLINLRQVNSPESSSAARFSRFSPPNFRMPSAASIIGNLGEPLADNEDDFDEEDHVIAEAYEDGHGAAVNNGEGVETSEGMNITSSEIEEVPNVLI
ncbi:hypothetical protein NM688_g1516 [Phlebia brevispora]|uniref:Uncharacterized protein n=1 Tax=Phlebia brevispora TaxID=194682 RepID=A0ACC1TBG2_9APHY|nr:hypothetical protein NM688_g1516 [Phlebia brevispora]